MAKLPPLKRLYDSDIPGAPKWFKDIVLLLNNFFQNVTQALNKNLTFQDNIRSQIIDIKHVGGTTANITTNLNIPLSGILVLQASGSSFTGGVFVNWKQLQQVIEITEVTGLTAGQEYNLRLLLI